MKLYVFGDGLVSSFIGYCYTSISSLARGCVKGTADYMDNNAHNQ